MPTEQFDNVTAIAKANIYFDGKVVSHSVVFSDDSKKTLGIIFAGEYHFDTEAPENMEVTAGQCRVKLAGADDWTTYGEGESFNIPANSGFDIATDGICQYICSFG